MLSKSMSLMTFSRFEGLSFGVVLITVEKLQELKGMMFVSLRHKVVMARYVWALAMY